MTEVHVRALLERATGFEPSIVDCTFMIHVAKNNRAWIVIVDPDADATLLVVVTAYEVSEWLSVLCRSHTGRQAVFRVPAPVALDRRKERQNGSFG